MNENTSPPRTNRPNGKRKLLCLLQLKPGETPEEFAQRVWEAVEKAGWRAPDNKDRKTSAPH